MLLCSLQIIDVSAQVAHFLLKILSPVAYSLQLCIARFSQRGRQQAWAECNEHIAKLFWLHMYCREDCVSEQEQWIHATRYPLYTLVGRPDKNNLVTIGSLLLAAFTGVLAERCHLAGFFVLDTSSFNGDCSRKIIQGLIILQALSYWEKLTGLKISDMSKIAVPVLSSQKLVSIRVKCNSRAILFSKRRCGGFSILDKFAYTEVSVISFYNLQRSRVECRARVWKAKQKHFRYLLSTKTNAVLL